MALRVDREESPAQKLSHLAWLLGQYGLPLVEAVPLLAALLSLPLTADYAPLRLSPEQQRQKTLHTLLTAPGAPAIGGGGVCVPAGRAAAGDLSLQACPDPGSGLSVAAQEHPPTVSSAHCPGGGGTLSRGRRDPARATGPPLYRGGLHD